MLEEPTKEEPAAAGVATVEPEAELVEVRLDVIPLDSPLVSGEQPPIEQAGDAVYAREELVGKWAGCDVALVAVGACESTFVGLPAVGNDGRARLDVGS